MSRHENLPAAAAGNGPDLASSRPAGLLEKLMGAVRPEFRGDLICFDPRDPVFGGPPCRVPACLRPVHATGFCEGHGLRWAEAGKPSPERFAETTDPGWYGYRPAPSCTAPGCRFAVLRRGLCQRHSAAWERAGCPELEPWRDSLPVTLAPDPLVFCRICSCELWAQGGIELCHRHGRRWKYMDRPDMDEFVRLLDSGPEHDNVTVDLRTLGAHLRLELQYALQRRRDEHKSKISPRIVRRVVAEVADSGVVSLLELPEQAWRQRFFRRADQAWSVLLQARRHIEDLAFGEGWEGEYGRDVWRLRMLRLDGDARGSRATLRFDRIGQPWLKDLAKRWVRWRISGGLGTGQSYRSVAAITRFSVFLASPKVHVMEPSQITRAVCERYLADLATDLGTKPKTVRDYIGLLNSFFTAIRQHGWESSLPASAMFFTEDYPRVPKLLPRYLAEHVMAQVEDPANLDRWDNSAYQLVTLILIRCGLRVSDAVRLPHDCIACDTDGAPYLRYYNHKMKREALVPIDEQLQQDIVKQQRLVLDRWPGGTLHLFPRTTGNLDGTRPLSSGTYRPALYRWLQRCNVSDEHGRPVHLTPHQWRHTLGTRLINRDVPQEIVRRILDHDSAEMTSHYARLHDTTVRRHWEQARKVNAQGQTVTLDPDSQLSEAAWAKQRLSRATQALPNGYCGLPLARSCPHANSCLTCPMFLTTAEFLPQHRQQRQQTLQIISAAEARGQTRMAEMNRQVADNLEKIITGLEADTDDQQQVADAS